MQDDRAYDGGSAFWISFGLIAGALIVGALCAVEGGAERVVLSPGEATPEQVEATTDALGEMMRDEGFTDEQIERVLKRHRCKYLPGLEECDETSTR